MKAIIIGGYGFIGYNLALKLLEENMQVTVFDCKISNRINNEYCTSIAMNLADVEDYRSIFNGIDVVYHLASSTHPKTSNDSPIFDIETNLTNTIKILDICREQKVKKVVFPSSGGTVYGITDSKPIREEHQNMPLCSYGIVKLTIEKYLYLYRHLYGLDYQVLRIANPYGPYQNIFSMQGVIAAFLGKVLMNKKVEIWGDGGICRDYIYIDDVVNALYLSGIKRTEEKIINIGSGKGISINELLTEICSVVNRKIEVEYKESRPVDVPINILDISKAKQHLGWEPEIDLKTGIAKTWEWIREAYETL